MRMSRRDCLRGAVGFGLASLLGLPRWALADEAASVVKQRRLLQVLLRGGADFRGLIVPEPDGKSSSYATRFWQARAAAVAGEGASARDAEGQVIESWLPAEDSQGRAIRFHPAADWLHTEFLAGRVAVVANVLHSTTRNHRRAQKAFEAGIHDLSGTETSQSGWGGRLLEAIHEEQPEASLVCLTNNMSRFTVPNQPLPGKVLCVPDSRNPGLAMPEKGASATLSRALESYYQDSPQGDMRDVTREHFAQIDRLTRELGESLANVEIPAELQTEADADQPRQRRRVHNQALSAYDCLAADKVLAARILFAQVGGFDTHRGQQESLARQWTELFSNQGSLASLMGALGRTMPAVRDGMVVAIGSEFGRQLRANGDAGTDHGRGNSVLLWAPQGLNGGVYGNLFPEAEDFEKKGADIQGLTDWIQVYGRVGDAVAGKPVADRLFPTATDNVEAGVDLDRLFA